jgi:hypothetical protein
LVLWAYSNLILIQVEVAVGPRDSFNLESDKLGIAAPKEKDELLIE